MVAPQTFARTFTKPGFRVPLEAFPFCAGNRGFTKDDFSVYQGGPIFLYQTASFRFEYIQTTSNFWLPSGLPFLDGGRLRGSKSHALSVDGRRRTKFLSDGSETALDQVTSGGLVFLAFSAMSTLRFTGSLALAAEPGWHCLCNATCDACSVTDVTPRSACFSHRL